MIHAKQRAYDRYNVVLSDADFDELVNQVHTKKSLCTKKLMDGEIHAVSFQGKALIAVYVPKDKTIVTFLPPEVAMSRTGRIRHATRERLAGHLDAQRHLDGGTRKKNYKKNQVKINRREREQRQLAAFVAEED